MSSDPPRFTSSPLPCSGLQSVVADPEVVPMDSRHRALERVARGGDPSDVARHLAERLRLGDLTSSQLELAAYCGDEASRLALGVVYSPVDYEGFVRGLPEVALLRGLVAAAEATLPHLALAPEPRDAAAHVLEAARAFCVDPSDAARQRWDDACGEWVSLRGRIGGWLPIRHDAPSENVERLIESHRLVAGLDVPVRRAVERELVTWALA